MIGQSIVNTMLKKAEEAEALGDIERADYWLRRASEVEVQLKQMEQNK